MGTKKDGFVALQTIAQRVQGGEQCHVGAASIMPPQSLRDVIDPFLGGLH
jgi:hypothetical protein